MLKLLRNDPHCITCNNKMHFSCEEAAEPGFVHDVFECSKCRSIQSYITPEQPVGMGAIRRTTTEWRSGLDTRSEAERQLFGERRSGIARWSDDVGKRCEYPSNDQLSLFAKRVRRAMRDERGRHFFGNATGEGDFSGHVDVVRSLEWIERLARD
jgi:hypothetical protein